jgi:hypothetical protein
MNRIITYFLPIHWVATDRAMQPGLIANFSSRRVCSFPLGEALGGPAPTACAVGWVRVDAALFVGSSSPFRERRTSFGQINVDRSRSVIWSIVGVVCPAWSSGVDNACSSQYFDSLFAYSLLGCFEMLSSGRSIFHRTSG